MIISNVYLMYVVGCGGAALVELLRWWKLRENVNFPTYWKSGAYWLITIVMVLASGFIAIAYGTEPKNAIELLHLGATAPAVIGAFFHGSQNRTAAATRRFDGASPASRRLVEFLGFG